MLLETLAAIILGNAIVGKGVIKARKRVIRTSQIFLITPHSLTNFKIQKYYQKKPQFIGA